MGKIGRIHFFIIIFSVLAFILLGISLGLILFFLILRKKEEEYSPSNTYLYTEISPALNQSDFGFVRIRNELLEDEYISYQNTETEKTVVITNILEDEYRCTGACFCDENRRNSYGILNTGLVITLSALTTAMAINIAKDAFRNSCQSRFTGVCEKDKIVSEVDVCENRNRNEVFPEEYEDTRDKDLTVYRNVVFSCHGYCIERSYDNFLSMYDMIRRIRDARKSFGDCTRLERTGEVVVVIKFPEEQELAKIRAKHEFVVEYLKSFCRVQSLVFYDPEDNDRASPACMAHFPEKYDNVKCTHVRTEELDF